MMTMGRILKDNLHEAIIEVDKIDMSADVTSKTETIYTLKPLEELVCCYVRVIETWDTEGTCEVSIGKLNDADAFLTSGDVKTTGFYTAKGADFNSFILSPNRKTIDITLTSQNNLNTATKGILEVHLFTRKMI